jgi:hypothetical protein
MATIDDIGAARDQLVKIIEVAVPATVTVHRSAFDGTTGMPMVIVGMPSWVDDTTVNYCAPHTEWPIAVCVARPGNNDAGTADQLDTLWPQVFTALRDASRADPTLAGICRQSVINRAQFGQFMIQGQPYPAQMITIDLYG